VPAHLRREVAERPMRRWEPISAVTSSAWLAVAQARSTSF
jgi:hypothetical protein